MEQLCTECKYLVSAASLGIRGIFMVCTAFNEHERVDDIYSSNTCRRYKRNPGLALLDDAVVSHCCKKCEYARCTTNDVSLDEWKCSEQDKLIQTSDVCKPNDCEKFKSMYVEGVNFRELTNECKV